MMLTGAGFQQFVFAGVTDLAMKQSSLSVCSGKGMMDLVACLAVLLSLVAGRTIDQSFMGGARMAIATFGDIVRDSRAVILMTVKAGHLFLMGPSLRSNLLIFRFMALLAILKCQGRGSLNLCCPECQKD